MEKQKLKEIEELCIEFNKYSSSEQLEILGYVTDKTDELKLNNINIFESLEEKIVDVLVEHDELQEELLDYLTQFGLDKLIAEALCDHCKEIASPYIDAVVVSSIEKTNLKNVCYFILEKTILYKDYESMPFEDFQKIGGFNDKATAQKVLRFIRTNYISVSNRTMSPPALYKRLVDDFKIPSELASEIVEPLKMNTSDIHQAYLMEKLDYLFSRISSLSATNSDEAGE